MKTTTFIQFTSLLAAFGSAYEIFVNGNYTHIRRGDRDCRGLYRIYNNFL